MNWTRLLIGILGGALAGFVVDYRNYVKWKNDHVGLAYDWTVGLSSTVIGAASGALSGLGLNQVGA